MRTPLGVFLILVAAAPGAAHQTSRARIEVDLDAGRAQVRVAAADLDLLRGRQAKPTPWSEALRLEGPGGAVSVASISEQRHGDSVQVELALESRDAAGPWTLSWLLFSELDPEHCALIRVVCGGQSRFRELAAGERWSLEPTPERLGVLDTGRLGAEHVLAGSDHLAFVAALVLGAWGCWRGIALAISAFTLGHAVSLLGLVLGCPTPPSLLIELGIALSVVYAGAAAALRQEDAREPASGPLLAGACGVLHGLGFGGALEELGLRGWEAALPLASFNVGVEGAQLAWAALVALACHTAARVTGRTPAVRLAAVAIGVAGGFMFCSRLA